MVNPSEMVRWLAPSGKARMVRASTVEAFRAERAAEAERRFNEALDRYQEAEWERRFSSTKEAA
jgi:hypothetical protein